MALKSHQHFSSFRDPAGYIFVQNNNLYRKINYSYKQHYDWLMTSGCYDSLVSQNLLIPHQEVVDIDSDDTSAYKIIRPDLIPLISFPYEWGFETFKNAAIVTLKVMEEALKFNMIIKDASPFNVQLYKGKLVFIDTLSFEKFSGKPWVAYRQFCESFLGPLLLLQYKQLGTKFLLSYPDGMSIKTISKILPFVAKLRPAVFLHILLHSNIAGAGNSKAKELPHFSSKKVTAIIESLKTLTSSLKKNVKKSRWSTYYEEDISNEYYLESKKNKITQWLLAQDLKSELLDLGCNTGVFSLIGAEIFENVYAVDSDEESIDKLCELVVKKGIFNIHPMVIDLANPTPSIGLNGNERSSFFDRVSGANTVLALAFIHHLVIGRNIPFNFLVESFSRFKGALIIEFVGENDPKVKLLVEQKNGVTHEYSENAFLTAFKKHFIIIDSFEIPSTERKLFLMKKIS
jgi:SAM-dependent methyltransferase